MKKKILFAVLMCFVLNACGQISLSKLPIAKTSNAVIDTTLNIPYSYRGQISTVIIRESIYSIYGEPSVKRKNYDVWKFVDDSYFFVFYKGDNVEDSWRCRQIGKDSSFDTLVAGISSIDDVRKIDPFLYLLETENMGAISEHRTIGGKIVVIMYQNENGIWYVKSLDATQDDPLGFIQRLESSDKRELEN